MSFENSGRDGMAEDLAAVEEIEAEGRQNVDGEQGEEDRQEDGGIRFASK
jgi:hypothetical protein